MMSAGERIRILLLGYAVAGLGYLAVNRLVGDGPFHHLDIPLDHAIPFVPSFVFVYILVYVVPGLSVLFMPERGELIRTFIAFGVGSVICFAIFLLFPVEFPRVFPVPDSLSGRVLSFVHVLDRPVNCFPSHHVATSFITWMVVRRKHPAWGHVFGAIAVAIALSTLFVKQHYIVDVPAGMAVAAVSYVAAFSRPRIWARASSSRG